jgi:hypothetical protein
MRHVAGKDCDILVAPDILTAGRGRVLLDLVDLHSFAIVGVCPQPPAPVASPAQRGHGAARTLHQHRQLGELQDARQEGNRTQADDGIFTVRPSRLDVRVHVRVVCALGIVRSGEHAMVRWLRHIPCVVLSSSEAMLVRRRGETGCRVGAQSGWRGILEYGVWCA